MEDFFQSLSAQQRIAAIELATGERNKTVAYKVGCHPNTIGNWKRTPLFAKTVRRLRRELKRTASRGI